MPTDDPATEPTQPPEDDPNYRPTVPPAAPPRSVPRPTPLRGPWLVVGLLVGGLLVGALIATALFLANLVRREAPVPASTPTREVIVVPGETPGAGVTLDPEEVPTADPNATLIPTPTPSGEPTGSIVYTCFDGNFDHLCRYDFATGESTQLTGEPATDWYGSFGPLGERIAFSSRRGGAFDIYTMSAGGGGVTQLTSRIGGYAPDFSPDLLRIVFTVGFSPEDQEIWVMDADGSSPFSLTPDQPGVALDPVWSPDGSRIAFSANWTGTNEIYVMDANGENLRQVTEGSAQDDGGRLDWAGGTIAFYAGERGSKEIYTVPAGCTLCGPSAFTQLTEGGNNRAPSFSPDGAWITYAADTGGDSEIWIMRADGTGKQQITDNTLTDWQPRWGQ